MRFFRNLLKSLRYAPHAIVTISSRAMALQSSRLHGFEHLLARVVAGDEHEMRAGCVLDAPQMVAPHACMKKPAWGAHAAAPGRGELAGCNTVATWSAGSPASSCR